MTITFVGHGYVGLVTAAVFADLGNNVYVIGRTKSKINRLKKGDPIIFEPGLEELLKKNIKQNRLIFTTDYSPAIDKSEVVFIAVGTPPKSNGEADLTSVLDVAQKIAQHIKKNDLLICTKSTVPVGTNQKIKNVISSILPKNINYHIASCPEFLREGTAINDTFYPDRIVIGSDSKQAIDLLLKLHKPLNGARVIVGLESAELIKYASNSLLATKISFSNLLSFICEKSGATIDQVIAGIGLDRRIGKEFLMAGIGYGGSCFPKDVKALINSGQNLGVDMQLLAAVENINQQAKQNLLLKIEEIVKGKKIAIWGLSFKPNTDDIRDAPSVYIITQLLKKYYKLSVYDPEAIDNIKSIFKNDIQYFKDPYDAVKNADGLIILTEWNQFKQIDLLRVKKLLNNPLIIDGRNIYDPAMMKKIGFKYFSVGRK